MSLKKFILGGASYEALPLEDKFIISAKRYLGLHVVIPVTKIVFGERRYARNKERACRVTIKFRILFRARSSRFYGPSRKHLPSNQSIIELRKG